MEEYELLTVCWHGGTGAQAHMLNSPVSPHWRKGGEAVTLNQATVVVDAAGGPWDEDGH